MGVACELSDKHDEMHEQAVLLHLLCKRDWLHAFQESVNDSHIFSMSLSVWQGVGAIRKRSVPCLTVG